jgi:phasin
MDMAESNPARKSFEAGARTAREALEKGAATAEQAATETERSFSSAGEGLRDFNAKLMDFGQANLMANLNFFAELARAKGPTEAFELWSRHAQEQMQRFTEQSQELGALGQRIASTSSEPLRRSFDQTIRRVS